MTKMRDTRVGPWVDFGSQDSSHSFLSSENQRKVIRTALKMESTSKVSQLRKHWKLFIVIIFSVLAMLLLSAVSLSRAVNEKNTAQQAINNLESTLLISDLVNHLQRERGMSTNFLASNFTSEVITKELYSLQENTDSSLNAIISEQHNMVNEAVDILNSLKQHRSQVNDRKVAVLLNLEFYTNLTMTLTDFVTASVSIPYDASNQRLLDSSNVLLSWTDNVGLQRALGSTFMTGCGWSSGSLERYFTILTGKSSSLLHTAMSFSNEMTTQYNSLILDSNHLNEFVSMYESNEIFHEYMNFCSNLSADDLVTQSLHWFQNMTQFIDGVFKIRSNITVKVKTALNMFLDKTDFEFALFLTTMLTVIIVSGIMTGWYTYCIINITTNLSKYIQKSKKKSDELVKERKKTETILNNLVPSKFSSNCKNGMALAAEHFDDVTISCIGIYGLPAIEGCASKEFVLILNQLCSLVDDVTAKYDVYKLDTIKQGWMIACGVPEPNTKNHSSEIAAMSLTLKERIQNYTPPTQLQLQLKSRIGIHTGPCTAGVVGTKVPRYCLFGNTVNTASELESKCLDGKIQISSYSKSTLNASFLTERRGNRIIKGHGRMDTYWLTGLNVKTVSTVTISSRDSDSDTLQLNFLRNT